MNNKGKLKEILEKKLKPGVRLNLSFSVLEADSGMSKRELEESLHDLEIHEKYIIGFYMQNQLLNQTADDFSIQLRENNV